MCLLVVGRFYWPAGSGLDVSGHQIGRDFINTWAGPRLAFSGRLATLFDFDRYVAAISDLFGRPLPFHNWSYPPFTLILFWPLALLPYFWALAVWTLVLFAAYAFVASRFVAPADRGYMLLALVCAPASIINAVGGQNGFLTAALLLGGVLALDKRPILAGVLLGLLIAKPQLGLALPLALLALRAWRTIAIACATAAVLVSASVAAFGLEPWRHYLTETSAYTLHSVQNFHGFYRIMFTSIFAEARTVGLSIDLAGLLQAAVGVPVLLTAAWAVSRTQDARRRAFVLAAAAPLITPYAFNYDLTALTAVLTWRLIDQAPQPWSAKDLTFRLAWLAPIFLMTLNMVDIGAAPLALIAVFAIAVREAVGRAEPPAARDESLQLAV